MHDVDTYIKMHIGTRMHIHTYLPVCTYVNLSRINIIQDNKIHEIVYDIRNA